MQKFLFFLLLSSFLGFNSHAQTKPLQKEFLDEDFLVLPSETGAVYRRETELTTKKGGIVRDYFLAGQLAQTTTYTDLRQRTAEGPSEQWYATGQLKLHREYTGGKASGELRTYYPSGQLKRRQHYTAGKRIDGECFAADGKPVPYFDYEILPVYAGGNSMAEALEAVHRNFRYPAEALRAQISGRTVVGFTITKTGEVAHVHVVQHLSDAVDTEALRVVQQLQHFTPAYVDGEAVNFRCTVPFELAISN